MTVASTSSNSLCDIHRAVDSTRYVFVTLILSTLSLYSLNYATCNVTARYELHRQQKDKENKSIQTNNETNKQTNKHNYELKRTA